MLMARAAQSAAGRQALTPQHWQQCQNMAQAANSCQCAHLGPLITLQALQAQLQWPVYICATLERARQKLKQLVQARQVDGKLQLLHLVWWWVSSTYALHTLKRVER